MNVRCRRVRAGSLPLVIVGLGAWGASATPARAAAPDPGSAAVAPASAPSAALGLPPASAPPPSQPGASGAARPGLGAPAGEADHLSGATPDAASAVQEVDAPRVVPTQDAVAAPSDHDAVVGAWGIEVRPVATTLPVFARRAATGCPASPGGGTGPGTPTDAACPAVSVSTLGVRHWMSRNLGLDVGAALALGGGSDGGRLLDSYFGLGPAVGLVVLLGNWKHLAVAASPNLMVVVFKGAGSADTAYVADLRADLEGELHFGFVGVPALSLGMRSGVLLRLEHAADVSLWSAGVSGATSVRSLLADLHLRYYF
ncbi:MAG: hypothetical protein ABUS79_08310 [Pseudomonadota bacterium]